MHVSVPLQGFQPAGAQLVAAGKGVAWVHVPLPLHVGALMHALGEASVHDVPAASGVVCTHVPVDVQLGIHLCYGDPGHKHIREPVDMGRMVQVYNRLAPKLQRPINWVHMPVPRNRDDDAYFEPLRDLRLNSGSELYLGLIHLTDGIDGARRRANAAKRVVSDFGVATECGFGRRPPETIPALLGLHQIVARDV